MVQQTATGTSSISGYVAEGMVAYHASMIERAAQDRPSDDRDLKAHPILEGTNYWQSAIGDTARGKVFVTWSSVMGSRERYSVELDSAIARTVMTAGMLIGNVERLSSTTVKINGTEITGLPPDLVSGMPVMGTYFE